MAVEADLDSNGPLARDLARVQKGKKDLDSVLERHADLLPGEAGRRVAQAIIDGERINRFRRVGLRDSPKLGLRAWENVFDDPVSQYVPLEAVRVARARDEGKIHHLLARLEGLDCPPVSHVELAKEMGWRSKKLNTRLQQIKRQHEIDIPSSKEQKDKLFWLAPLPDQLIPATDTMRYAGLKLDELLREEGVKPVGDDLVSVPTHLLREFPAGPADADDASLMSLKEWAGTQTKLVDGFVASRTIFRNKSPIVRLKWEDVEPLTGWSPELLAHRGASEWRDGRGQRWLGLPETIRLTKRFEYQQWMRVNHHSMTGHRGKMWIEDIETGDAGSRRDIRAEEEFERVFDNDGADLADAWLRENDPG